MRAREKAHFFISLLRKQLCSTAVGSRQFDCWTRETIERLNMTQQHVFSTEQPSGHTENKRGWKYPGKTPPSPSFIIKTKHHHTHKLTHNDTGVFISSNNQPIKERISVSPLIAGATLFDILEEAVEFPLPG